MQKEIEVKFLHVNHDMVRAKLRELGAELEKPMMLMRRVMYDFPDMRLHGKGHGRLRIRDEGDKVVLNYKSRDLKQKYADELETIVGSFDISQQLLEIIGLEQYSYQESKRETWYYRDVEIVLDEWPWVDPYIEIEGPSESSVRTAAEDLAFNWDDARYGSVDRAYEDQYPGMKDNESIGEVAQVRFSDPLPQFLADRQQP